MVTEETNSNIVSAYLSLEVLFYDLGATFHKHIAAPNLLNTIDSFTFEWGWLVVDSIERPFVFKERRLNTIAASQREELLPVGAESLAHY